jgi:hypothetical protein
MLDLHLLFSMALATCVLEGKPESPQLSFDQLVWLSIRELQALGVTRSTGTRPKRKRSVDELTRGGGKGFGG